MMNVVNDKVFDFCEFCRYFDNKFNTFWPCDGVTNSMFPTFLNLSLTKKFVIQ